MDEFYGMNISEEDQRKITRIRKVIPKNIQGFILTADIQKLLKTNISELDEQIITLFSQFGCNTSTEKREAIKKIIYPEQTTKINNNNINITSVDERTCLDLIKNNILSETSIEIDDKLAKQLLIETNENMSKATLLSVFQTVGANINENKLSQVLNNIKKIADNYQLQLKKNFIKTQTIKDYISDERYATNPIIVQGVSDEFTRIFNYKTGLSEQNVKNLLMSNYKKRQSVLSDIIKQPLLFGKREFEECKRLFLSFIDDLVNSFNNGENNKKKTTQEDKIFSDKAVKGITNYLVHEYKNNGVDVEIDFTNGGITDKNDNLDKEVLDNAKSRFSLKQINQMLRNGVSPNCLLAIHNFDIYIKYQYLAGDILNADISKFLCEQFIDFLYMDISGGRPKKQDTNNIVTPVFVQTLITKYVQNKTLNSITEIKADSVISALFYSNDGKLRDKKEINKLLGTDEQILEIFMNAAVDPMLLSNIINLPIKWDLSDDWLNKIKANNFYNDYNGFLDFSITIKKLQTFTLSDLLEGKNKNQEIENLLSGKKIKCGKEEFKIDEKQISQTKVIKVIAQDLDMIKSFLISDKDKSRKLEKLFDHLFWFTNPINTDFFTELVYFLRNNLLADLVENIDDISDIRELKNILKNGTLIYLFKNIKSDFVMSILLDQLLGNYLQIGNWTVQEYADVFTEFFKIVADNKNFDLRKFKKVFIKTFVAKTKDMSRAIQLIENNNRTVLEFVLAEKDNINSLLEKENANYKFNDDEISYFDICLGTLGMEPNNFVSEEENAIHDYNQEIMDNLVFDFLLGKFKMHEEIKNEIIENNKNENENGNRINIESKNKVEDNEIKKETASKEEKTNDNQEKLINYDDYRTDEEINRMLDVKDQTNNQKTDIQEIKLECIADLYNIDQDTVKDITNLDTGNLSAKNFFDELNYILNNNKDRSQKVKNQIKKCYIDQFFFGKAFTKIALIAHNKTQKYDNGKIIDFQSNWKNCFNRLFNSNNVFDREDIDYFWTIWEKRCSYFNNQIKLGKIEFTINSNTIDSYEECEKQYSKGITEAKKSYSLDKEILKSKDNIELDKYNLHAHIIQEIDLQVESSHVASFENFFFGYLGVLKKTVTEVEAEFTKENLADFQKCYIQKFLMCNRNNKSAKPIDKQFLLDMYFFFNKNSGNPQNIFGKEVVDYFNSCMKKWFVDNKEGSSSKKSPAINLKFDKKLEPLKSSILDEIQIIKMDQKENLGLWFLEYLDPEKTAREKEKKRDEIRDFISKKPNKPENQEKTETVYFDSRQIDRKLPFDIQKKEEKNDNGNRIKIDDEKKSSGRENKNNYDKEINSNKKDDNQKNKEVNDNNINDKNRIEKKAKKINQDDLHNKKENNNRNDITKINNINNEGEKEEKTKKDNSENIRINTNNEKESVEQKNKIEDSKEANVNEKNNNQKKEVATLIKNERQEEKIEIINDNQNFQENNNIKLENIKSEKETEYKNNQNERIKTEFHQNDLKINSNTNNNNIIINNNEDKNNKFEENNLIDQTGSISTTNNSHFKIINNINSQQNNQTIKINCLPNYDTKNEYTEYMSILYGLNTEIINEIDVAISNLRFTQNFDFLAPLNQIFNQYGKQKEEQIKQYYMDRFFDSNIFKTHMQEETFESMFERYFDGISLLLKSVFDNDDISYFWNQWRKTVLLHFDSQQFKNQKLNINQNFCFETNYSPSKSHNISLELVNKINSSIENLEYYKPEDFFRGYYMLFKQENKELINKDNKLGIQKYYIESFLIYHMEKDNIDTKFLRHVDFRFRGYLLKKQTIFNDEAVKYFYELLEKLLLGNKENEIVKNEVSDEINGHKIKNFEVKINTDFIEKQEASKNCRNYKIAFWVLIVLAVLSGGAIYFSAYFAIPLVIALACSIFCFIKKGNYDRKISDLVGSEKCLLPEHQIKSYKNSVKDNVICDIDYFAEIQEDEKSRYNYILDNRNNIFGVAPNYKGKIKDEKE